MTSRRVLFSFILLSVLHFGPQAPAVAADPGTGRLALTDAMLKMMDAMGMIGQRLGTDRGNDFGGTWESMAPGVGPMPWQGGPARWAGTLRDAPSHAWTGGSRESMSLQGDWASNSGERLQIRGSRFRLQTGAERKLDGALSVRGHLLALYSPRHDQTWICEFAEQEGRLALRDVQGRLYLYRRVQPRFDGFSRKRRVAPAPWIGRPRPAPYPEGGFAR